MEYRSKYKAEEIEAILDAKNNTGEGVDSNLDEMFTGQLQTKEVEVSEDTTIKADEGFLGLKEVSVKVSGGGGSGEEKIGMLYVTKGDIFTLLEQPSDIDIPQDEFMSVFMILDSMFPFVANKGVPSSSKVIISAERYSEEIAEGRFTCAAWSASAVDFDRVVYKEGEFVPMWKTIAPTIADAKVTLSQMFPNQMTEAEFFA